MSIPKKVLYIICCEKDKDEAENIAEKLRNKEGLSGRVDFQVLIVPDGAFVAIVDGIKTLNIDAIEKDPIRCLL